VGNTLRSLTPVIFFPPTTRQEKEDTMHPLQVAARFTAFVWRLRTKKQTTPEEAVRFAKENWLAFLPAAHEGLGNLLIAVATVDAASPEHKRRPAGVNKAPKHNLAFSQHRQVSLKSCCSLHGKATLVYAARHSLSSN
jgi:hypothetical protein